MKTETMSYDPFNDFRFGNRFLLRGYTYVYLGKWKDEPYCHVVGLYISNSGLIDIDIREMHATHHDVDVIKYSDVNLHLFLYLAGEMQRYRDVVEIR